MVDVRSSPYSARLPHFNREPLKAALRAAGIRYLFLGAELGARRAERSCYVDGVARYDRIAKTTAFQTGLERVTRGAPQFRSALMCAEKDPIQCHRTLLISRELARRCHTVQHLLIDGSIEHHGDTLQRLVHLFRLEQEADLFRSTAMLTEDAQDRQSVRIAYERDLNRKTGIEAVRHLIALLAPLQLGPLSEPGMLYQSGPQDRERRYQDRVANWSAFETAARARADWAKLLDWAERSR